MPVMKPGLPGKKKKKKEPFKLLQVRHLKKSHHKSLVIIDHVTYVQHTAETIDHLSYDTCLYTLCHIIKCIL